MEYNLKECYSKLGKNQVMATILNNKNISKEQLVTCNVCYNPNTSFEELSFKKK